MATRVFVVVLQMDYVQFLPSLYNHRLQAIQIGILVKAISRFAVSAFNPKTINVVGDSPAVVGDAA